MTFVYDIMIFLCEPLSVKCLTTEKEGENQAIPFQAISYTTKNQLP